jgi:S-formylglutathione hydrolase FrmB
VSQNLEAMRFVKLVPVLLIVFVSNYLFAANVDTVSVYSNAMHKDYKCVVIKPANYKKSKTAFPVVYLLHGYDGWYSNWIIRVPELKTWADLFEIMIVCPEGTKSSWYFDSPVDSSMKFETYIGMEVPAWIDAHYHTIADRKGRAITGLSMGGHGGLFLAFRHADIFGACGSMSGGVELYASRNKFEIIKRLGDTISHADNWTNYSVIHIVETPPVDTLHIIIDCGMKDIFFKENHALHEKLLSLKIAHDYIERPGQHDWPYWRNAVKYQLMYFKDYFIGGKW